MLDPLLNIIIGAIWFIIPAYFANGSPVIVGGGKPIDGGRMWRDGKRIFGDGKTYRGFIGGVLIGSLIGLVQFFFEGNSSPIFRAFFLSLGALIGDLIGSFIKRRMSIDRGRPALGMDQLGFIFIGFILVILAFPLTLENFNFTLDLFLVDPILIQYTPENFIAYAIFLFPFTFLAHIVSNLIVRQTI
ncbi:MAG: CDP-2,3-bis-(O-geranylgeranyl)-sn-glycerol synthase [Candidatus Hodarchaeales archaeon]|jgi:CDP-2,3-bis-(O-geranylgeranyl)-sn-glycerol synthase